MTASFHRETVALTVTACCFAVIGVWATEVLADEDCPFDLVIHGGRVMDPETELDGVRTIGIRDGSIVAIETRSLSGQHEIDAKGLVVAPGFIDVVIQLPSRYQSNQLLDGVTTYLNLSIGTDDVERWYSERDPSASHYGVSIGHERVRRAVMGDEGPVGAPGDAMNRAASDAEIAEIIQRIERGLAAGALAVSITNGTHAATGTEMLEVFRAAARAGAMVWGPPRETGDWEADDMPRYLTELIGTAAVTGAGLNIVHLQASGGPHTPRLLEILGEARAKGLDVSADVFPYSANYSHIRFWNTEDWRDWPDEWFHDLESMTTGERLTRESLARFLAEDGYVIVHNEYIEPFVTEAVASPHTMLVSLAYLDDPGRGHPRSVGAHARLLGHYVRELGAVSLMEALRKMSLMPAQRLEARLPAMEKKGRIQIGADADIVIFDAEMIIDRSTFRQPARPSEGVRYLLVNGVPVVWDGDVQSAEFPGRPLRAGTRPDRSGYSEEADR